MNNERREQRHSKKEQAREAAMPDHAFHASETADSSDSDIELAGYANGVTPEERALLTGRAEVTEERMKDSAGDRANSSASDAGGSRQRGFENESNLDEGRTSGYRRFLWLTGLLFAMVVFGVCLLNYIVDPLQYYRQAAWYTPIFSEEQRFQNASLASNWEYNTIILGTSMTENFVPSHVDEVFGGGTKTMKLSISGSSLYEERLAGETALRTGQVERIIWGLDYASFRGGKELLHEEFGPYPKYLYDTNPFNDVQYLFNVSTTKDSLRVLKRKLTDTEQPAVPLDLLNNWQQKYNYAFNLESVYNHYKQAKEADIQAMEQGERDSLEAAKESFDHNILRIVREHPEVEMHFFYPPYSILRFQLWYEYQPERFYNQLEIKEYIYAKLSGYPNVYIHDFQSVSDVTHNLSHYKDVSHYSQDINAWMIEQMTTGSYETRSIEDVKRENAELVRQVEAYEGEIPAGDSGK